MDFEPWVGDRVLYDVGNKPPEQAQIISIANRTEAAIRIPDSSSWEMASLRSQDATNHPEEGKRIEVQYPDGQTREGRCLITDGWLVHMHIELPVLNSSSLRWRYIDSLASKMTYSGRAFGHRFRNHVAGQI